MISQLTGTIVEMTSSSVVMDVGGIGFELGVSANTLSSLPHTGEAGVTLLVRLVVRDDALELYGFTTRAERALFDRLRAIPGVGSKLALAILSTYAPATLAQIVVSNDADRMAQVPGIGKKKASTLLLELSDVFTKDPELRGLVGLTVPEETSRTGSAASAPSVHDEATEALLSMGFTSQEAELALDGATEAGAITIEQVLSYALKRLGGGR